MTHKTKSTIHSVRVAEVMSTELITLNSQDTIQDAARAFVENNISGVPVLGTMGEPIGVITKTDLARFEMKHVDAGEVNGGKRHWRVAQTHELLNESSFQLKSEAFKVAEWMTPMVFDISPDAPLKEAIEKMYTLGIHHLFVKNPSTGHLIGVVTTFDLLKFLSEAMGSSPTHSIKS